MKEVKTLICVSYKVFLCLLFCPQSVFILAEKTWAGSNLLYKWQKTLGNYIAVAG